MKKTDQLTDEFERAKRTVDPPDRDSKLRLLRRKASIHGIDLPDDVAHYLVRNSKHNLRELEGDLV